MMNDILHDERLHKQLQSPERIKQGFEHKLRELQENWKLYNHIENSFKKIMGTDHFNIEGGEKVMSH